MSEKLGDILDSYLKDVPLASTLKLPKLKKVGKPKKIELPKLKKVN